MVDIPYSAQTYGYGEVFPKVRKILIYFQKLLEEKLMQVVFLTGKEIHVSRAGTHHKLSMYISH